MDLKEKLKELADFLYNDVASMRSGDINAKERIGSEVMSVNAIANAIKTLKEEQAQSHLSKSAYFQDVKVSSSTFDRKLGILEVYLFY